MIREALRRTDPEIAALLDLEDQRQREKIRLIPSENYTSRAVLEAAASALSNKYSEGYPGRRYYEGQQYIDEIEKLCIARAKALFSVEHANVQPYSGSPANLAVYLAFCKPGDVIMGLGLPAGGHLTHGWSVSISGKYFTSVAYGVRKETGRVDLNDVEELAVKHRPKLLFCGGTAVPRTIDFAGFATIAKKVGAILVADIAHIAGLVAGGAHPSPVGHAEVITSTTHKTLRGPRGGLILCNAAHAQAIDRAVFPGLQGGPHNAQVAGLAVALREAQTEDFRRYAEQIVRNAQALAAALAARGYDLVSGGTDNHLILIDLTNKGISGKRAAQALDRAGLETNYNSVPFDPRKPFDPSGLRIGTPAVTSRGLGESEMGAIAAWIDRAIVAELGEGGAEQAHAEIAAEIRELLLHFPAPGL
jgi:glycine hydroxymethyltransferase